MQVLAELRLKAGASPESLNALIEREEAFLYVGVAKDAVRQVWSMADRIGGWAMLEVADLEAARALVGHMPAVEAGLVEYQLHPLAPFRGFEVLFNATARAAVEAQLR